MTARIKKLIALSVVFMTIILSAPSAYAMSVSEGEPWYIDAAHISQGYIEAAYNGGADGAKLIITSGIKTYTYSVGKEKKIYTLTEGSGAYQLSFYEHVEGSAYKCIYSLSLTAELENDYTVFLLPSYMADHSQQEITALAREITAGCKTTEEKIEKINIHVAENISYDYEKAGAELSLYSPDLKYICTAKTGICLDYSALTAGLLRSQGIPACVIFGYSNGKYHAWVEVIQAAGEGENSSIRLDPTFLRCFGCPTQAHEYIQNDNNYIECYRY